MSNSNKVSIDNLSSQLMKYLQEFKEDIDDEVKETSDKIIKEATKELKQVSPEADKIVKIKGNITVEPRKLCKILEYKEWEKI
ncbi:MAG: hypothetical protein HFJ20_03355 [Clostridia bacterium]|nr:hypothetical protein [Clostridia bacterium]